MLIDESVWVKTWASGMNNTRYSSSLKYSYDFSCTYDLPGYKANMSKMIDSDSDGIPDSIETSGMITNIGTVIKTDPKNSDSDGDGLSDGEEMGGLSTTQKFYERSDFFSYVNMWIAEAGYRPWEYVYFNMVSNPLSADSDGDGSNDGRDRNKNYANGPVNYILMGEDDAGSDALSCMREPYLRAFEKLNPHAKVVVLDIRNGSEYQKKLNKYYSKKLGHPISLPTSNMAQQTFQLLKYKLDEDEIVESEEYSYVDKMIIITHGQPNWVEFKQDDMNSRFTSQHVMENVNPSCLIKTLDLQCCYCGAISEYYYETDSGSFTVYTCLAEQFAKKNNIENVYAWTSKSAYSKIAAENYSYFGKYIHFYRENGKVKQKEVDTRRIFWTTKGYEPLQY